MITKKTLIKSTSDTYSSKLQYNFDGFNNGHTYMIDINIETQNPNGGLGMIIDQQNTFNVNYQTLRVLNKPILTELCDKSAIQIDWANICQNPATITGNYSYIDNYIFYGNKALKLENGSTLKYNSTTIPSNFTLPFMITLPKDYNGIIFTSNNNNYQVGYDNTLQKFYTLIDGITTYGELIKITDNPFYITMLGNRIIIRQYNIYKKLSNIKGYKLSSISGYPLDFMGQGNN